MSLHRLKRILLADHRKRRAHVIASTLRNIWKANVCSVANPTEALEAAEQIRRNYVGFDVVLVAFGFGGFLHTEVFRKLIKAGQNNALIDNQSDRPLPNLVESLLFVPDDTAINDSRLVGNLGPIMGPIPPQLPTISNAGRWNDSLKLQVRWLDPNGVLSKGKEIIRQLVCQNLPDVKHFNLYGIRQGFSGARVFRISYPWPEHSMNQIDRVLKLTPTKDYQSWKCMHEVQSYPKIREGLGGSVLALIPEIQAISVNHGEELLPARCGDWLGVMYIFLGNNRCVVADFEQVFLDPRGFISELESIQSCAPSGVDEINLSSFFLDRLINTMADWYKQNHYVKMTQLWSAEEAPEDKPLAFPPYCFRPREKNRIIQSVHSIDEYGLSLRCICWKKHRDLVLSCLPKWGSVGKRLQPLLKRHWVLFGNVHGDLNTNNILMALDYGVPFLIDFACYQSGGHLLQDFARLEVAIKVELMGREKRNSPDGHDLNLTTFPKWCKAEDWLSNWPADDTGLAGLVDEELSTMRAYTLCQHVRSRAENLHTQILSRTRQKPNFRLTYSVALLYHTVRAIGYESLPHLKRIFATYCAGKIVEHLQRSRL